MPYATIPNSSFLDLFGYRTTNQTTVEAAYGISPAEVITPTYGVNVALVLPRANQPTFLAGDWASRQQTLSTYTSDSLWKAFGADKQQFDSVKQQVEDLGLKVVGSDDPLVTSYVTSPESRTIWVHLDNASDFNKLFHANLLEWGDGNNLLFWNGQLSLPTEWKVNGLWFDVSQYIANPSNLADASEVSLAQGPQGIGNASPQQPAVSPQTIAQGYNFPLNGQAVQTGTIALIEPGIGTALPPSQTQTFQQLLDQYVQSVGLSGTGKVYTEGAGGQVYFGNDPDERSLDVGTIAGVNPNSNIGLYVGSGNQGGAQSTIFTSIQSAIWDTKNNPAVISSSFSGGVAMSPNSPFNAANWDLMVDAALRNQTLLRDAFDGGSGNELGNGLTNLRYDSTSPYGIVVGGTSISSLTNGPSDPTINTQIIQPALAGNKAVIWQLVAGGLTSLPTDAAPLANFVEAVWNQYYVEGKTIAGYDSGAIDTRGGGYNTNWTGSGGVDPTQGVPSYQLAYGLDPVTSDPQAAPGRGAPDVSGLAGGNLNYLLPNPDMVGASPNGGTSASTPLWATLVSQLNFIFHDQGLPQLGYMNDLLYIASAIAPASFNDITLGNNISSFVAGQGTYNNDGAAMPTGFGYSAGPGYDLTSGLGSPNGLLLARALTTIAQAQTWSTAPAVFDNANAFSGVSTVSQTLLVQDELGAGTSNLLGVGTGGPVAAVGGAPFAWTSRLAEQSLQKDFDPALAIEFDGAAQGTIYSVAFNAGQGVAVFTGNSPLPLYQANLTNPFGFVEFGNAGGDVTLARPVAIAQTAGGASNQDAILRLRQVTPDSVKLEAFKVDDLNGTIGGIAPGQAGYAAAAAARDYRTDNGTTVITGPGYGNYGEARIKGVNPGDIVALHLTNASTGDSFWAFAAANEKVDGTNVNHLWSYGLNTFGWEATRGGGDRDYNDLIVGIDFTSASGHGWLV